MCSIHYKDSQKSALISSIHDVKRKIKNIKNTNVYLIIELRVVGCSFASCFVFYSRFSCSFSNEKNLRKEDITI